MIMDTAQLKTGIDDRLRSWERVLKLSRKPRREEFIAITKVTGLGVLVIGGIGFAIRMIVQILERLT